ncbi:MAG: hypothetical protein B7Z44_12350 [Caulobacter sp. 12-67-6]|nr:MAG: hypothetical protein B7Z44_12350 [Caulobacter sp. 12-67-6]OYX72694.1 MAG: hypothetical protein B7Y81_05450 [Caulobacter sp. 32-67-35]OZA72333.1 MAG: hypothetical protein B7X77_11910 [Caulobacter sp. 39-67-4]HQR87740.1 DUF1761 domain-containing protein [Caulobacter sp.]
MKTINWLGLVAALVVGQVIGIVWYGSLFSAAWQEAMEMTQADFAGTEWRMSLGLVNMVVILIGLDWLIGRLDARSWMAGARVALAACIFFALTVVSLDYIYAAGNLPLLWIDGGYQLLTYVIGGALLGGLRLKPKAP